MLRQELVICFDEIAPSGSVIETSKRESDSSFLPLLDDDKENSGSMMASFLLRGNCMIVILVFCCDSSGFSLLDVS